MTGSIWLTPPRTPRNRAGQSLSRDQVASAAVQLADRDGLEAVTMRSVATRLGISPMSLYWYVDSKSQVVELMIEAAFREQPAPRGADWRSVLRSLAHGNRRRYQAHPWLNATHDREHKIPSPAQLDHYERTIAAITTVHDGLTASQLNTIIAVINHTVAGYAAIPFPGALTSGSSDPAVRDYLTGIATDGKHPSMAMFVAEFIAPADDHFDAEIDVIIDGLSPFFG